MTIPTDQFHDLVEIFAAVIAGIMFSEKLGPFKAVRETLALAGFLTTAEKKYGDNTTVQQIIKHMKDESADAKNHPPQNIKLGEGSVDTHGILTRIAEVNTILADSPDAAGVKQFLYELAEAVANASGSGFLGLGQKISPQETEFLQGLKQTLGI
jgi:hypothetical protein